MSEKPYPDGEGVAAGRTGGPPGGGVDSGEVRDGAKDVSDEQITQVEKERDDLRDQLLRSRAEFVNYQKRAKQQADSDRVYAVGSLARDLLDAIDNLERAGGTLRASGVDAGIVSGLDLIHKQILEILARHGVEPIPAMGLPFDPNFHEAMAQLPDASQPEGTVVVEMAKGYKVHDRVLRPSRVAVSTKSV
jgi:molecular chaperone GrpE